MSKDFSKSGASQQELADFRALQDEMLNISRESSQARQALWATETKNLQESWDSFSQEWQGSLEQMTTLASSKFEEIAAGGETACSLMTESWTKSLGDLSGDVQDWGDQVLQVLGKVAQTWGGTLSDGGGFGSNWTSLLDSVLSFGGWFHQGGIVEAHQGMVISPATLMGDEQLIMAQAGEGILPRESMARLGEKNFEALRTGQFEALSGSTAPRYEFTIQVQSLDAAGVAGLDWNRVVERHLLPALQKEAGRRW